MSSAGYDHQQSLNPAELLVQRWRKLLDVHLPVFEKNSIWRYSRLREKNDPEQGWKLHVSATILNAAAVLESVSPFLKSRNVFYKAPVSLHELKKLNSGIFYDYSQIGKFLTIYPQNDEQSVEFAERLHVLTEKYSAPAIPFEARFDPNSSVYYRYGAFKINYLENADGSFELAMRDEKGGLVTDVRETNEAHPAWISSPFPVRKEISETADSPLKKHFRVFRALSQRGKGGVYEALDVSVLPPRRCLLKEGRKNGETEWNGRDGFWRVRHEASVLRTLRAAGINVPKVYSAFAAENNFYLAAEFIEGENLHAFLKKRKRRLNVSRTIALAIQLAALIKKIHASGWLWRDCKPDNLMIIEKGELRPLDFEGACLIAEPDPVSWSTLTFKAANQSEGLSHQTSKTVDLYALGAIMYLLSEGEMPPAIVNTLPVISQKNIPSELKKLIAELLNPQSGRHPEAEEVELRLREIQSP